MRAVIPVHAAGASRRASARQQAARRGRKRRHLLAGLDLDCHLRSPRVGPVALAKVEREIEVTKRVSASVDREIMLDRFPGPLGPLPSPVISQLAEELMQAPRIVSLERAHARRGTQAVGAHRHDEVDEAVTIVIRVGSIADGNRRTGSVDESNHPRGTAGIFHSPILPCGTHRARDE